MRSYAEIKKKLRNLRYRYLKRYLEEHLSVQPANCVYNREYASEMGPVRLCMLGAKDPENWPGNLCDTKECAQTCPFFQNKYEKKKLKEDFVRKLQDPNILYTKYRDLAMLQWALEEDILEDVPLTWWQRLKLWFRKSE